MDQQNQFCISCAHFSSQFHRAGSVFNWRRSLWGLSDGFENPWYVYQYLILYSWFGKQKLCMPLKEKKFKFYLKAFKQLPFRSAILSQTKSKFIFFIPNRFRVTIHIKNCVPIILKQSHLFLVPTLCQSVCWALSTSSQTRHNNKQAFGKITFDEGVTYWELLSSVVRYQIFCIPGREQREEEEKQTYDCNTPA